MSLTIPITQGHDAYVTSGGNGQDAAVTIEFRGVTVTITPRSSEMNEIKDTEDGTMLVLVDTAFESPTTISVQINDDPTWEGVIR
jgi:hypothetical protein